MNIPRILIAGTNSGCGKTTVSLGLMAAFVKKGLTIQPYKVGPDYIDPMYHTFITGRDSRNLDSWMLTEERVRYLFAKNSVGSDMAVVEGVMGIFDGYGGNSLEGSSAHVSDIIKAPVVLVINGEGMSLSIAAIVKGFMEFDRRTNIKSVIINNIKSEAHYIMLKEIIEEKTGVKVAGYLAKNEEISLKSRHLGLVPSQEIKGLKEKLHRLAENISKTVDLELLQKLAKDAEEINIEDYTHPASWAWVRETKPRIGVARDKAFNFYYKDNLDLLEMIGAELVYFSPIADKELPKDIDGLYIGGGYPEVWAEELEKNTSMLMDIKNKIENNLPAYAECGGLMYLCGAIYDIDKKAYNMANVIDAESEMTSSLQRFGYVELQIIGGSLFSEQDLLVRAHEFHYSKTIPKDDEPVSYKVWKRRKGKDPIVWNCGYKKKNLLAGYPHIHFWSNPEIAYGFVRSCAKYKAAGIRTE
ncbi:MAG: cobyrinate a,c-diamide synthase [Bacillota bacterium]|nr:cobyrinate a,c-diamide synthase [Bacillota bacterium]